MERDKTPDLEDGRGFWDDIELTDLKLNQERSRERGRTPQRQRPGSPEVTIGRQVMDQHELRKRQTTPSPGRSDLMVTIESLDDVPFVDALESSLKSFYGMTHIRNIDQLYYQMIPDTLLRKDNRTNEFQRDSIFWIKTEHLYWTVLDSNFKDACVLTQISTGPDSALLAIAKDYMDEVVQSLWEMLYSQGRVFRG